MGIWLHICLKLAGYGLHGFRHRCLCLQDRGLARIHLDDDKLRSGRFEPSNLPALAIDIRQTG